MDFVVRCSKNYPMVSRSFHANLFEAAIDAQAPVQPYAVSYVDAAGVPHDSIDFIGEMTFAQSMVRILCGKPVTARLECLAPLDSVGAHRRDLALAAHAAVATSLGVAEKTEVSA